MATIIIKDAPLGATNWQIVAFTNPVEGVFEQGFYNTPAVGIAESIEIPDVEHPDLTIGFPSVHKQYRAGVNFVPKPGAVYEFSTKTGKLTEVVASPVKSSRAIKVSAASSAFLGFMILAFGKKGGTR